MLKRIFDVLWSTVGLCLLWPLFLLIALLVKAEDRGPVFFRHRRIGRNGQNFEMWKFRTMVVDAEKLGPSLTVGCDVRVTTIGRWLRLSKLDELPQLLNVWVGDMSLVGPRPEVQKFVELYSPKQRKVLELRPGITDLASIKYRKESLLLSRALDPEQVYVDSIMPEKIRINLEYASRANIWTDFQVILLTLSKGFSSKE